jgi:tripartite-type tricarboxylate transporter receptor subunit TctC
VLVENKVGASGMLATDFVAKSAPDGYTLTLSLSTALLINQFLYNKMPYNPQKDLLLLSQVSAAAVVLVVNPSVPATDMPSLLAWCKANKGKVSYGSWGVGSYAHLGGAYMSKALDADMTHVAYKGEAPMMQDLLGGQLQFCFTSALNAKPFLDAGRIKSIGVTGNARMPVLPNVPTIHEQAVKDPAYLVTGWIAIAAPAGVPKDVVDTFYAALQEASKEPAVQERLNAAGFVSVFNNPVDFAKVYVADMAVWKNLVETAGAKLE